MSAISVDVVDGPGSLLADGPVWDHRAGELIWVDIEAGAVWTYAPRTDAMRQRCSAGQQVGAVCPRLAGGLVAAARDGFGRLADGDHDLEVVVPIHRDDRTIRLNDGKADARGRFWAGTLSLDDRTGRGDLYCLDHEWNVRLVLRGVTDSNGLDWSPENHTMYYIDSGLYSVQAFDFDEAEGTLTGARQLVAFSPDVGQPDGMTVDSDGGLWVAVWGAHAVHRYSPTGVLEEVVDVPVSQVTSCVFGDADLRTLYITSARIGMDRDRMECEPLAGRLFRCRPGVAGRPAAWFAG